MKQYVISINGQKAIEAGYAFVGNHCFRKLYKAKHFIGQLEVVLDSEDEYKGILQKWVDVTVPRRSDLIQMLDLLANNGFKDCPCIIQEEEVINCFAHATTLCCIKI